MKSVMITDIGTFAIIKVVNDATITLLRSISNFCSRINKLSSQICIRLALSYRVLRRGNVIGIDIVA